VIIYVKIHGLLEVSPPGPPPGLHPAPTGGLRVAPRTPARLGIHFDSSLGMPLIAVYEVPHVILETPDKI
jgi:hypothetical protein